jgi:hypothetical protein
MFEVILSPEAKAFFFHRGQTLGQEVGAVLLGREVKKR